MGRTVTIVLARTEGRFRSEAGCPVSEKDVELTEDEKKEYNQINEDYIDSMTTNMSLPHEGKVHPLPTNMIAQRAGFTHVANIETPEFFSLRVELVRYLLYLKLRNEDKTHENAVEALTGFDEYISAAQHRNQKDLIEKKLKEAVGTVVKTPFNDADQWREFQRMAYVNMRKYLGAKQGITEATGLKVYHAAQMDLVTYFSFKREHPQTPK